MSARLSPLRSGCLAQSRKGAEEQGAELLCIIVYSDNSAVFRLMPGT